MDESVDQAAKGGQYLVFKVGRYSLALGLMNIRRVHDAEGVPPRTPGSRVLDLYQITGAEAGAPNAYWIEMDVGERRYLMPVENVEEIRDLNLAVPMPYPPVLVGPETGYFKGLFFDGFRMIVEIDPEKLVEMTEGLKGLGRAASARMEEEEPEPPRPDESGEGKPVRLLYFEVGAQVMAVDLNRVVQIINRDEIHEVPAGGQKVLGVVYHAEQAVPVIAPEAMGVELAGPAKDIFSMIILAEARKGLVALGCERIIRVAEKDGLARKQEDKEPQAVEIELERLIARLL